MKKYLKGLVEKVEEDGILTVAVATDSSIDRDGERIDSSGWDFSNFEKNPVLLWAHDYRQAPIGKVLEIKREGDKILFRPQFALGISEMADMYFNMYKDGFLNAFSVGFIPREWKDADEGGKMIRTFTKAELLEISAVPVPANANALVLVRGMKGFEKVADQMESFDENAMHCFDCGKDLEKDKEIFRATGDPEIFEAICGDCSDKKECESHKDFEAAARDMAIVMGAGGSKIAPENRLGIFNHLVRHYAAAQKEAPAYELVLQQILKDVSVEFEKHIIVQVVKADDGALEELRAQINSLTLKSLPGENGKGGGAGDAAPKVDALDELLSDSGTKRLLQIIDKSVGEVLRRAKSRR